MSFTYSCHVRSTLLKQGHFSDSTSTQSSSSPPCTTGRSQSSSSPTGPCSTGRSLCQQLYTTIPNYPSTDNVFPQQLLHVKYCSPAKSSRQHHKRTAKENHIVGSENQVETSEEQQRDYSGTNQSKKLRSKSFPCSVGKQVHTRRKDNSQSLPQYQEAIKDNNSVYISEQSRTNSIKYPPSSASFNSNQQV